MRILIILISTICLNISLARTLTVKGKVLGNLDISAISCMDSGLCILGSDETNSIQTFTISNQTIKVGRTIGLGKYKKENDIEAITNDGEYFYITGSHGLSRKKGKYQASRFLVFRLKLTRDGKLIDFKKFSIEEVLSNHKVLKKYFKSKKNGVDIEGLAYHGGKLYFGFRSPIISSKASILAVDINQLLADKTPTTRYYSVELNGLGVRSLEFKGNKAYIVSGGVSSNTKPSYLNIFDMNFKEKIKETLLYKKDIKPEALEIIGNEALILHDSIENGAPKLIEL